LALKQHLKKTIFAAVNLGRRRDCLFILDLGASESQSAFLDGAFTKKNNSLFVSNDKNLIWRDLIFESKQSTIELLLKVTGF